MSRKVVGVGIIVLIGIVVLFSLREKQVNKVESVDSVFSPEENLGGPGLEPHPLSIQALKEGEYPGSDIVIEQTLDSGSNYKRYIASYKSEGLKIYGLLTIPSGPVPRSPEGEVGWPVVIFNHGYISPSVYKTTEKYVAYQDAFARAGYITFKSDYRGHGNSEGDPSGAYGSNAYTIDVLNSVSSIKKYPGVNPESIGMWGHSMGGHITLRNMVVNKDVKAGVIWAGVVGSYPDLVERWRRRMTTTPQPTSTSGRGRWRQELIEKYGEPNQNPTFWNSISDTGFLDDISGPVQLHHGTADSSVPIALSVSLSDLLQEHGKEVELFTYEGDDHNLSKNFSVAMQRSVEFFDKYLK